MVSTVLTDITTSITELKKNPMAVVEQGEGFPVAVLNRNRPAFYCVPAATYEVLMEKIDDIELARLVAERQAMDEEDVSLDDL